MLYLFLAFLGAVAWFIGTAAAGGAVTILMPIVGFMLGVELVAPTLSLAALIANPGRIFLFRKHIHWPSLRFLLAGSVIGSVIGASLILQVSRELLQLIIAIFLILTAANGFRKSSAKSFHFHIALLFPVSFFVALLSGLIGGSGPILNPFLAGLGLKKEELIANKSVNSLVMQLSKILTYGFIGLLSKTALICGVSIGVGAIVGVYLSKRHLQQVDDKRFALYFNSALLICGLLFLYKVLVSTM